MVLGSAEEITAKLGLKNNRVYYAENNIPRIYDGELHSYFIKRLTRVDPANIAGKISNIAVEETGEIDAVCGIPIVKVTADFHPGPDFLIQKPDEISFGLRALCKKTVNANEVVIENIERIVTWDVIDTQAQEGM